MRIDFAKWNKRRLELESTIRAVKTVLATPGHMGSVTEWRDLGNAAYEATSLYMLRAELRGEGRLHATHEVMYIGDPRGGEHRGDTVRVKVKITREDQRKRAFAGWHHDYLKAPEPTPVAEAGTPAVTQS